MTYDFTTLRPRIAVGSGKWDAMAKRRPGLPPEVIPLSVADMEFPTAPEIVEHLVQYAEGTILGYTQRGQHPSAYDSSFAIEAGNLAVKLLSNGIGNQVVGIKDGRIFYMPIADALRCKRPFNMELYNLINSL